ncbi:G5 domain-containing protein [Candidatus Saccharibacteria bacterium]|nr:G5 domain-containing protein [Candidatus Saccharibacteria bacterium]
MVKPSIVLGWVGIGVLGAVVLGGATSSVINRDITLTNRTNGSSEQPKESIKKPEVVTTTETKTIAIPYDSRTVDDNSLAKDTYETVTAGANGEKVETYSVTYTDGVETSRELISTKVTKEPVTEVIAHGTYVAPAQYCPNGSYTNAYGNQVCRPSTTYSSGATAVCRDGTYSSSQSRRGTCSHHGGVAQWL